MPAPSLPGSALAAAEANHANGWGTAHPTSVRIPGAEGDQDGFLNRSGGKSHAGGLLVFSAISDGTQS